jgi:hypothetical protein
LGLVKIRDFGFLLWFVLGKIARTAKIESVQERVVAAGGQMAYYAFRRRAIAADAALQLAFGSEGQESSGPVLALGIRF